MTSKASISTTPTPILTERVLFLRKECKERMSELALSERELKKRKRVAK